MIRDADVYRVAGRYYATARGFSTRGTPVSAEPYVEIHMDARDCEKGAMIMDAVRAFGATVPHPKSWSAKDSPLMKLLGLRSWKALVRENAQCSAKELDDGSVLVRPWRTYDGKGFEIVKGEERVIPDADPAAVWQAVKWALDTDFD